MVRQSPSRFRDSASQVLLGRFFLDQGVDPKQVLDKLYNEVKERKPNNPAAYLASGDLALEKQDYALAAEAFEKAIQLDAGNPDAHFGLAQAFAASEREKAQAALNAALAINPNYVEACCSWSTTRSIPNVTTKPRKCSSTSRRSIPSIRGPGPIAACWRI